MEGRLVKVNDAPAFCGYPDLIDTERYGLKAGEQIDKIGLPGRNGLETSSHRVHDFKYPVEFSGVMKIPEPHYDEWEKGEFLLFKIPSDEWSRPDSYPEGDLFLMYLDSGHGYLWVPRFRLSNMFQYKAVFRKVS